MKRLHLHMSVEDIATSVAFYSTLFAAEPAVIKSDYAKWMLQDPRVNFAISTHRGRAGLDHLGIQVETPDELADVYDRLQKAGGPVLEEGATTCCYAHSEKSWIADPQGVFWETFLTASESTACRDGADLRAILTAQEGSRTPEPAVTPAAAVFCCGQAG
jgi:predicted enzyme related to lactoylglutathione lyase